MKNLYSSCCKDRVIEEWTTGKEMCWPYGPFCSYVGTYFFAWLRDARRFGVCNKTMLISVLLLPPTRLACCGSFETRD
jgi:hypothetical protein